MMNTQFNTTNIPTQHGIQMAQQVATSPNHASAAVINTFLNAQQEQHQQLAAAGPIYADHRQLQLNPNTIDKNYYATTAATLGTVGAPQRFYTTTNTAHHPNTILITNNFSHQQTGQPLNADPQQNIRIVATSNPINQTNNANLATSSSGYQHAQHVFNLNNNKHLQHLFPQHLLSQPSFQAATSELLPQNFATQPFSSSPQQQSQNNHAATSAIQVPHYYMSPENTSQKIISIPSNSATSADSNATSESLVANCSAATNSTVVLDRINICINNLYTDTSSSSASNSLTSTPAQQPSPIIPAIQHKPIVENGPSLPIADIYEANVLVIDEPDSTTTATTPQTPPKTPESTPSSSMTSVGNNVNNSAISTTSSMNSPSTSYSFQKLDKSDFIETTKQSFVSAAQSIEVISQDFLNCTENVNRSMTAQTIATNSDDLPKQIQPTTSSTTSNAQFTLPSPPSPEFSNNTKDYMVESKQTPNVAASATLFANGEDVFIKRHDDRFYLGTVIDTARNQFLVRFDDKTKVWCEAAQMRKLGVSSANSSSSAEEKSVSQPMCVACKRIRFDSLVEICERCGRGYHRKCTSETSPGSEIWICKRCAKPMKLNEISSFSSGEEETEVGACFQLHYNLESLSWDDKHRTNEEQIYCYCGQAGKFDYNMLQCWKCLNWYHTHCTQKFIGNLMRGDCFFVFCCSVCNNGDEYLRRIQAGWVDVVHLVLYNLSSLKKHHKYHHLHKEINPYVLEKRKILPIPKEWISMPEKDFLEEVKNVLLENPQLFMCGKEIKRDVNSFALRSFEPPIIIKFSSSSQNTFDDDFVFSNLKLPLLYGAPENCDTKLMNLNATNFKSTPMSKRKLNEDTNSHDVYEFDDTSEDEIPIKQILDKVKKTKLTSPSEICKDELKAICNNNASTAAILEKMDVEDDNANDTLITSADELEISALSAIESITEKTPKKEVKTLSPVKSPLAIANKINEEPMCNPAEKTRTLITKPTEKSSRKRKAFTLSKSYNAPNLIDSSSDENSSSSSRGTSLDLIIPPPKNFLGQNNPFRIISPKKNISNLNASAASSKKSVSFGIFNTTALNFSSKLAALKSAGLFPKLNTSNLGKAAGQPRTVRTIKRRLSAKDITIGPNKEVRRRRTRRLSSNIEVISTTTINPIPTNFFPIQAKDLLAAAAASTTTAASLFTTQTKKTASLLNVSSNNFGGPATSSLSTEARHVETTSALPNIATQQPTHGRRLRQRPQKISPNASRRSSVSSNQSSTSSASVAGGMSASQTSTNPQQSHEDFKQTVNKYFGIVNRIESCEQFSIRAKRQLANGQMQYLIEWGETQTLKSPTNPIQNHPDQSANSQLMEVSTAT